MIKNYFISKITLKIFDKFHSFSIKTRLKSKSVKRLTQKKTIESNKFNWKKNLTVKNRWKSQYYIENAEEQLFNTKIKYRLVEVKEVIHF